MINNEILVLKNHNYAKLPLSYLDWFGFNTLTISYENISYLDNLIRNQNGEIRDKLREY